MDEARFPNTVWTFQYIYFSLTVESAAYGSFAVKMDPVLPGEFLTGDNSGIISAVEPSVAFSTPIVRWDGDEYLDIGRIDVTVSSDFEKEINFRIDTLYSGEPRNFNGTFRLDVDSG